MNKFFKNFGFNKAEQIGFIVFLAVVIIILFVPYFIKSSDNSIATEYDIVYFEDSKDESDNTVLAPSSSSYYSNNTISKPNQKDIVYFEFDPNNLDASSWSKLGFTDKQIKVIKNYEAKGGRFYKKEDVAKIYAISVNDFKRIEPYISIDKNQFITNNLSKNVEYPKEGGYHINTKKNEVININDADTTSWKSLSGIGSTFAKRIVKYRDVLGGFHSIDQLSEVYGLTAETFDKIKPYLKNSSGFKLVKLNVNTATVEELAKHPYISKKQSQSIVNYRFQHGAFKQFENLTEIQSLDKEFLRKIEPYLEF